MEGENVWLNRKQLSDLFDRDIKTIGKHINNALNEELNQLPVVANFATTATDGKTYHVDYYNLDMILSIGYRVKSSRGILFRQWANKVLKDYMLKGYTINHRIEGLEKRMLCVEEKIDFFVHTSLPPVEGIFYEGQIFDAYVLYLNLLGMPRLLLFLLIITLTKAYLLYLENGGKM